MRLIVSFEKQHRKFCYFCNKLKAITEFRSAGYTRKGIKTYKARCKECEKELTQEKSPKRFKF